MDEDKKYFSNARKPEGEAGRQMLERMNGGSHAVLAGWGLSHIGLAGDETVLDIGCGGGGNLARLLSLLPRGRVVGIDYSETAVEKSLETNALAIKNGRCEVRRGDVSALPLPSASFDLATAFETVYFWPTIEKSLSEVHRVLKNGGRFLIVNESDGLHEESLKWTKIIDGMTVYTGEELQRLLKNAGFSEVEFDDDLNRDRLTVIARKTSL